MWIKAGIALAPVAALAACHAQPAEPRFPKPDRPVAPIVSDSFSTEDARDRLGEAEKVIEFAGIKPGMWVADVGAGEGYYTTRLSPAVGPTGRVLAEDIDRNAHELLSARVQREGLENVAVKLGTPDNPMLPAGSFDRIFLVHMYHEVTQPYAFLWHLRQGLKKDGEVVVVDSDRPIRRHGTPPMLLTCEMSALGLAPVRLGRLPGSDVYAMTFRAARPRPEPATIEACSAGDS